MSFLFVFLVAFGSSPAHSFLAPTVVYKTTEGEPFSFLSCTPEGGTMPRKGMYVEGKGAKLRAKQFKPIKVACDRAVLLLQTHSEEGYRELMKGLYPVFELFPEPVIQWHAFGFLAAHMGEGHWRWSKLVDNDEARAELTIRAKEGFITALRSPGGYGNPWVHLRLGEIAFDAGDKRVAGDELTRAYMGGGRDIFRNEDAKYFIFLESILLVPPGQHHL